MGGLAASGALTRTMDSPAYNQQEAQALQMFGGISPQGGDSVKPDSA